MGKSGLGCIDLSDSTRFTVALKSAKWRTIEFLAGADAVQQYMVVSNVYGQPLQLMNMETYETVEHDSGEMGSSFEAGMHVDGLVHDGVLYLLPFE